MFADVVVSMRAGTRIDGAQAQQKTPADFSWGFALVVGLNVIQLLFNNCEDVAFFHDEIIFATNFDFGSGVIGKQYAVAALELHDLAFAVFHHFTVADSNDGAFLWLIFGRFRKDDAALTFCRRGRALNDNV